MQIATLDRHASSLPSGLAASLRRHQVWLHATLLTLLVISRRPDALLHAQFWAEDGRVWFQDAYAQGWHSLFLPQNRYLQTLSRLAALAAIHLPLAWAPTLYAMIALAIQVLPPVFLLRDRFAPLLPAWPGRVVLAYFYVAVPNSFEVNVNITNAQWHLGVLGLLIAASPRPLSARGWLFDLGVLALLGFSSPFGVFLLPGLWWRYWRTRDECARTRALLLSATAALQIAVFLGTSPATRAAVPLGASIPALARILLAQIVMGAMVGESLARRLIDLPAWHDGRVAILLVCAAFGLCLVALRRGPDLYRQMMLFAGLQLTAGLASPMVSLTEPPWKLMDHPGIGSRYVLIPMLAWFATLLVLAAQPVRAWRLTGLALAAGSLIGVVGDWVYPRFAPDGFPLQAQAFDAAPPGTTMTIAENPPGWTFTLTRH